MGTYGCVACALTPDHLDERQEEPKMEAERGAYSGLCDTPSSQAHADGPSGWGRANRPAGRRARQESSGGA